MQCPCQNIHVCVKIFLQWDMITPSIKFIHISTLTKSFFFFVREAVNYAVFNLSVLHVEQLLLVPWLLPGTIHFNKSSFVCLPTNYTSFLQLVCSILNFRLGTFMKQL